MAAVPRFRRSRRTMLAILVAAFLLGVQGGLAILPMQGGEEAGGGDGDADRGQPPARAPEQQREEETVPPRPLPAPRSIPESPPAVDAPPPKPSPGLEPDVVAAAGLEPGDAPPEDPADPAPDPVEQRRHADADRLWGCVRTMGVEDLRVAFEAADAASRLELRADGKARLAAAWSDLVARVGVKVETALRDAGAGEVGAASQALAALAAIDGPGAPLARRVVRAAAAARGVDWNPERTGAESDLPDPDPLPRGMPVAFRSAAGVRFEGLVRAERRGVVSVEVDGASGRRFPSAPRLAIEPLDPSAPLALAQCRAALAAGERCWAVAWWVRARALGADGAQLALLAARLGD